MEKYIAYPGYKDSGVEWLGNIPSHWRVTPVKYLATLTPKKSVIDANKLNQECTFLPMEKLKLNSITLDEKRLVNEVYDGYTYFENGDVLMAKVTPCFENKNIAVASGLLNGIGFGSSEIYVLRANNQINNRFLYYRLQEDSFMDIATAAMSGAGGLKRVPSEIVNGYSLAKPELAEQLQIANFLDYETAKIDTLIEKQQQLIKLLKEKRQAMISHAVTKGLNSNALMKDSGVEWFGEVPEHWVVTRAKYVSKIFVPQRNKPELNDSSGMAWATMEDMKQQYIYTTSNFVSPESILSAGSKLLKAGSVIASCVGNFGVTSINKIDVIINQQLQAFQPVNIKAEYLQSIVTLSKQYFELIGTAATLVYVNQEGFENLPVLMPTGKEQSEISDYILEKNTSFDLLIEKSIIQISLLKERRTALISAAVTGKIDVRHWERPYD